MLTIISSNVMSKIFSIFLISSESPPLQMSPCGLVTVTLVVFFKVTPNGVGLDNFSGDLRESVLSLAFVSFSGDDFLEAGRCSIFLCGDFRFAL